MRRILIAVIALTLAIGSADACHRYSRWYYPWKQSCRFSALAPPALRSRARIDVAPPARPVIEIPLPSLTDIDWGHAPNDELRTRLLLWMRGTLIGKEDK